LGVFVFPSPVSYGGETPPLWNIFLPRP